MLSLRQKDASLPVVPLTGMLTGIVALLLMRQPNLGETVIFVSAWVMLLMLAGVSIRLLGLLALAGVAALVLAYFFYPVATARLGGLLFAQGAPHPTRPARPPPA